MFLRSTLTKFPRVAYINIVRTCTSQIATSPPSSAQPTETKTDWKPIYKFSSIIFLGQLSKLKIHQSILTSIGVPVLLGLESFQIVPIHSTELFAILGITGTITLSLYSLWASKVIGYVYVNTVLRKIRFGYLDFWGRRQNLDLSLKELVSADGTILNVYNVVKTTTPVGSLKLLKYGTILDKDTYYGLFGDI